MPFISNQFRYNAGEEMKKKYDAELTDCAENDWSGQVVLETKEGRVVSCGACSRTREKKIPGPFVFVTKDEDDEVKYFNTWLCESCGQENMSAASFKKWQQYDS